MSSKILLVDDDIDFVESTRAALEAEGYQVATASDSKQGMEAVRAVKPDVVILDVMMSWILDGLRMSLELQADPELKRIPVIMVSSIANTEYAGAFPTDQALHVDAFLSKPVRGAELAACIKKVLASRAGA